MLPVQLAPLVLRVPLVPPVLPDLRVLLARPAPLVLRALLALPVQLAPLDLRAPLVPLAPPDLRGFPE